MSFLDAQDLALARELQQQLPDRVFDAHAHPFLRSELDTDLAPILKRLPEEGGLDYWRETAAAQVGSSRLRGGLFFGLPVLPIDGLPERIDRVNRFLVEELQRARTLPDRRGLLLVSCAPPPPGLETLLQAPGVVGFKPYAGLNPACGPQPDIQEYLPEWACELAHQRGLVIVLHILKQKALEDEKNLEAINRLCRSYPRMQLILAHAGAGFNMYHTIRGCEKLVPAENLWFDLSAVCEPPAVVALLKRFGPERLLWGSDYPISLRKGRFVTLGDLFYCIQETTVSLDRLPVALLGLENLRAVLEAVRECALPEGGVEAIFYENAARLLNL